MHRRGFTIVELLVAMTIFVAVGALAMTVFLYQNRNWKTESDKAEVAMMAKGTLDEFTRCIRSTGAGLPEGAGGIKVGGHGETLAIFVTNDDQWIDTMGGSTYLPGDGILRVAVRNASMFSEKGNALVTLRTPPIGTPRNFVMEIRERIKSDGGCGDSLVLEASSFAAAPLSWIQASDVQGVSNSSVYNLDSLGWRKSHDSLFVRRNRLPESVFAVGVDSLRLRYWHPVAGWQDSLSGLAPANQIDKVWLRLVTRNLKPDPKLRDRDPASRGFRFSTLETEVALRNTKLLNR